MIGPEELEGFRRRLLDRFPNATDQFLAWGLSYQILVYILGIEWGRKHLNPRRQHSYFMHQANVDTDEAYIGQHRVLSFARNLYELQSAPFFDDMVRELRTRSLLGAATEVDVAYMFHKSGHPVGFVQRTGTRGDDYDQVVKYGGQDVCVEVKAKEDDTPYSDSTLRASLREARQQLPKQGPGIIVIRIPSAWVANRLFVNEAVPTFTNFLRNSARTNAVVAVWEEWTPALPQGRTCFVKFRIIENPQPRTPVRDIDQLIAALSAPRSTASM